MALRVQARNAALVAAVYALAVVALTWPVILAPGTTSFADYGDVRGIAWSLWARAHGYFDGASNALLAAPYGVPASSVISEPVTEQLLQLLTRIGNEIAALNIFAMLGFWATAMATYALCMACRFGAMASSFAGLMAGFCPAAVMQVAGGHPAFAFNAFVPLFLLALLRNRAARSIGTAFAVALAFAAVCGTSLYIGYFAAYVGLFFVTWDALASDPAQRRAMVRNYFLCAAFALLLVVPVEFMALHEQLTAPRETVARAGHVRDFHQLSVYSARAWDYLLPPIDHPLFGRFVEGFVRENLHGSNVFEQTLYLGVTPLVLLAVGLVLVARRAMGERESRLFLFFATGALWMYLVSLPPQVGTGVPTPSYFAYAVAPMFRVYARAGIVVALLVGCAAAVVLDHWRQMLPPRRFTALAAACVALLAFEYSGAPPARWHSQPVPEVYRWLAAEPGRPIVAEYPMMQADEAAFYTYPFWQRIHSKPLVNGATPSNAPAWKLYKSVRDLSDPRTPALLRAAGVKYVIVHEPMYAEGPIPSEIKRYYPPDRAGASYAAMKPSAIPAGLAVHRRFGSDTVFTVTGGS